MRFVLIGLMVLTSCSDAVVMKSGSVQKLDITNNVESVGSTQGQNLPPTGPISDPSNNIAIPGVSSPADNDEPASMPHQVNGAYLHCITLNEATDSIPVTSVGCRFENKKGVRVSLESLGVTAAFRIKATSIPGVTVTLRQLTSATRIYEANLDYRATTKTDSALAASESLLAADLVELTTGAQIVVESVAFARPSLAVERGKLESITVSNVKIFPDTATNLTWGVDDQTTYTWDEANTKCLNLVYALPRIKWRLPTVAEYFVAMKNGVGTTYTSVGDMGISPISYWTADIDGDPYIYFMDVTARAVYSDVKTSKYRVLCVGEGY